jgi:acyl carrier protein
MTREEVRSTMVTILGGIAPEVDLAAIRSDADLREELDIDSMDFLRIIVRIQEQLGVSVPESDYPLVRTLDGCVAYVMEKRAKAGGAGAAAVERPG